MMYRILLIIFSIWHASAFPSVAGLERSQSLQNLRPEPAEPYSKKTTIRQRLSETPVELRKHYPIQVLKKGELYQATLGPDSYAIMFKVKDEKTAILEVRYDISEVGQNWYNLLNKLAQEHEKEKDTRNVIVADLESQLKRRLDVWVCLLTDQKLSSFMDFQSKFNDQDKLRKFYNDHIIMLVSSATESSVPVIENTRILRNAHHPNKMHSSEKGYPRLSMPLHSFTAHIMQEVYPKKYLFFTSPLGAMNEVFLKYFPRDKDFSKHVIKQVKVGKAVMTPTGREYGDFIVYPNKTAAKKEKGGIYTSLGWLRPSIYIGILVPLKDVADLYFKGAVFKEA